MAEIMPIAWVQTKSYAVNLPSTREKPANLLAFIFSESEKMQIPDNDSLKIANYLFATTFV